MNWLSVNEVATELRLGRSAIYTLVSSGQLACYRIGPSRGRLRFKPEDIEAYIEAGRIGPNVAVPAAIRRKEYVSKYDHSKPGSPLRKG
jgi:excisionase family DNA binding protein